MNTDSYKVLKLSNGEMIICEINAFNNDVYDIMNPLKMEISLIRNSKNDLGETLNLTPWLQHFTDQKYFNIEKNHCILITDASVGLSKYYEYVMLRIDDSWDNGDNLTPEDDTDDDVYDDLLEEIKAESKLIH
mgnify:FL=1